MNEKILVVDDDDLVRSGLALNLERAGFEVFTASHSGEVHDVLRIQAIDLVLCDLVLGDENGMDILRTLQSSNPDVSVVIITGHGSIRNALEALKGGASDYIQKPADPEEVIHRIRMVLDSVNLRRTLMEERHRSEERKKIIHDQLNRTERMSSLGTLAEGAAGDLRNILKPVEGVPQEIRKNLDEGHEAHEKLQELEEALRKASSVIHDLEMIGKANNREKNNVQVNHIISEFLRSSEHRQLTNINPKVKILTELEDELPAVIGSQPQLRQMIANLITNALESMMGGGLLRIKTYIEQLNAATSRFGGQKSGDFIVLRFEDTATRMSEEDVDRLFEPFYVRSRMGRKILSGLGLTLVYRVVEDHGGHVDIRTDAATGNVLSVYLPISKASDTAILELRPDYTGGEKVLLVDDSEQQRKSASDMLRELGYEVIAVESGYAAVELARLKLESNPGKPPFDLMVIDLVLGDAFDGVETFKKIQEIAPGQKAVLASGFADITRIVEARKLGIARCFQKPYTTENLGKNVRLALDEE